MKKFLLIVFILFSGKVFAQDLTVTETVPSTLPICGSAAFTIKLTAADNPIDSAIVTVAMRNGIKFNGTFTGADTLDNNPARPIFLVKNIQPSASKSFTYNATASCSVPPSAGRDSLYITYYQNGAAHTLTSLAPSYTITTPVLSYNESNFVNFKYSAVIGETFQRSLKIVNTSTSVPFTGEFTFNDDLGSALMIKIHGISATASGGAIVTGLDTTITAVRGFFRGGVSGLHPGDTLIITETISIIHCLDVNNAGISQITFNWGCPGNICKTVTSSLITPVVQRGSEPLLKYITDDENGRNFCTDPSKRHFKYKIYNGGRGLAQQIKLRFYSNSNFDYTFIDSTSIKINLINSDGKTVSIRHTYYPYPASTQPTRCIDSTINEALFEIDTLRASLDTLVIEWDETTCCVPYKDKFGPITAQSGVDVGSWDLLGDYRDECLSLPAIVFHTKHLVNGGVIFQQEYEPTITNLAGMPIPEKTTIAIDNKNFGFKESNLRYWDRKRFQIKVVLKLDQGLKFLKDSSLYFRSTVSSVSDWHPDTIMYLSNAYDTRMEGYKDTAVVAVFSVAGLDTTNHFPWEQYSNQGNDLSRFLSKSQVIFSLEGECPIQKNPSAFRQEIYFNQEIYFKPDSTCTGGCEVPVSALFAPGDTSNTSIEIHCPGCISPGIVASKSRFYRTNLGYKDTNDDFFPDQLPLEHVTISDSIRNNRAMIGDTLAAGSEFYIVDGQNGVDNGITYDSLKAKYSIDLRYLYINENIDFGDALEQFGQVKLKILSGGVSDSVMLPSAVVVKTSTGRNADFFYHLSIDSLHKYGLNPAYEFKPYDKFFTSTHYKVIKNIKDYDPTPGSPNFYTETAFVRDYIYLTGKYQTQPPNDTLYTSADISKIKGYPYSDSTAYYCERYGTAFTLIGNAVSMSLETLDFEGRGCTKIIRSGPSFSTGLKVNRFPYEFRPGPIPDSILIFIPAGYRYDSSQYKNNYYRPSPGADPYVIQQTRWISPDNSDNDTLLFLVRKYFVMGPEPSSPSAPFPVIDENYAGGIDVYISPTCNGTADATEIPNVYGTLTGGFFGNTDVGLYSKNPPSYRTVFAPIPNIIVSDGIRAQGKERIVKWDFNVRNSSNSNSRNTYLSVIPPADRNIIIDSIIDPATHKALHSTPDTSGKGNKIYKIGNIAAGQTLSYSIIGRFFCKQGQEHHQTDSIQIVYGWSCTGFPVSIDGPICQKDTVTYYLDPSDAGLNATLFTEDTAYACDTLGYYLKVNATGIGSMYKLKATVTFPPEVNYVQGTALFHYPDSITVEAFPHNVQQPAPNTFVWETDSLDSKFINTPFRTDTISGFGLSFKTLTSCNYNLNPIQASVSGISYCSDTITVSPAVPLIVRGSSVKSNCGKNCCNITANAGRDTTICAGSHLTLGSAKVNGVNYSWSPAIGLNKTNIANPIATPNVTTTYILTASTFSNCVSVDTVVITVNPVPGIGITYSSNTSLCPGGSIILNATVFSGEGTSLRYQWTNSGNIINQATGPAYTAIAAGQYSVQVTTGAGCVVPVNSIVNVTTITPQTYSAGRDTTICLGKPVTLGAAQVSGVAYHWTSVPSVFTFSQPNPLVTPLTNTQYILTAIYGSACVSMDTVSITVIPSPATPVVTGATQVCEGNTEAYTIPLNGSSVSLISMPAGAQASQFFAGPPGAPPVSTVFVVHFTTQSGNLVFRAANASGCTKDDSIFVTVNPFPIVNAGSDASICKGDSAAIGSAPVAGTSYIWSPQAGLSSYTIANPVAKPSATTTYIVTATKSGCSKKDTMVVNVNPLSIPNITGPSQVCAGSTNDYSVPNGVTTVLHSVPSGCTISATGSQSGAVVYHITFASTSGNVVFRATNAKGCIKDTSIFVTVNPLPPATIIPSGATTFCQGGKVTLQANTGTGLTYQWILNNNIKGTNSSYDAVTSGNYSVRVTNSFGCSATSGAIPVTVNPLPSATITPSGATTFCQGGKVTLQANTGTGLTYQWISNNNIVGTNPSYDAITSGNYSVRITDNNTCSNVSGVIPVTVIASPVVSVTASGPTTFCSGDSVTFTATPSGMSYKWLQNGSIISGANLNTFTASSPGDYSFIGTDAVTGCFANSNSITVSFLAPTIVNFTATGTFCTSSPVSFLSDLGTAPDANTYNWNFGTGATPSTYNGKVPPSISYGTTGTKTITLHVTGTRVCNSSTTLDLPITTCSNCTRNYNSTIGNPNTVTTLSGNTTFNGKYHIIGNLVLQNGIFTLNQGTTFYVDGKLIAQKAGDKTAIDVIGYGITLKNATLIMNSATITSACDIMWTGVGIDNSTQVNLQITNSEISNSKNGVYDLNETGVSMLRIAVSGSQFLNNYKWHLNLNNNFAATASNSFINNNIFTTVASQLKKPYYGSTFSNPLFKNGYTGMAVRLINGDFSASSINNNTIDGAGIGFGGFGTVLNLTNNPISNVYSGGIVSSNDGFTFPGKTSIISGNTINVPLQILPAGTSSTFIGAELYGNFSFINNTINGNNPFTTGIMPEWGVFATAENAEVRQNNINGTQIATIPGTWYSTGTGIKIQDNAVSNAQIGVNIIPFTFFTNNIKIRCNTFSKSATLPSNKPTYGIYLQSSATINGQGSCTDPLNPPAGNKFVYTPSTSVGFSVARELSSGSFNYTEYSNVLIPLNRNLNGVTVFNCQNITATNSTCSTSNGAPRLAANQGDNIRIMMDTLKMGYNGELPDMSTSIIDYHRSANRINVLETYTDSLKVLNIDAFNTFALFLMDYYIRKGNGIKSDQWKTSIQTINAGNIEIANRIKYFDVYNRINYISTSQSYILTAQDTLDLKSVASSGTSQSILACLKLRSMGIDNNCFNLPMAAKLSAVQSPDTIANPSFNNHAELLGQNIPNPFTGQTEIPYNLPDSVSAAKIIVYENISGRIVKEFEISETGAGKVIFYEADLVSGIYLYNLVIKDRIIDRKKMVLLK